MSVPYVELTREQLAARRNEFAPDAGVFELEFQYHGKDRVGRVEAVKDDLITLLLTKDGDETFALEDKHFKSFKFDAIESGIEIYKLP